MVSGQLMSLMSKPSWIQLDPGSLGPAADCVQQVQWCGSWPQTRRMGLEYEHPPGPSTKLEILGCSVTTSACFDRSQRERERERDKRMIQTCSTSPHRPPSFSPPSSLPPAFRGRWCGDLSRTPGGDPSRRRGGRSRAEHGKTQQLARIPTTTNSNGLYPITILNTKDL